MEQPDCVRRVAEGRNEVSDDSYMICPDCGGVHGDEVCLLPWTDDDQRLADPPLASRKRVEDETAAKIAAWLRSRMAAHGHPASAMTWAEKAIADAIERGEWRRP